MTNDEDMRDKQGERYYTGTELSTMVLCRTLKDYLSNINPRNQTEQVMLEEATDILESLESQ